MGSLKCSSHLSEWQNSWDWTGLHFFFWADSGAIPVTIGYSRWRWLVYLSFVAQHWFLQLCRFTVSIQNLTGGIFAKQSLIWELQAAFNDSTARSLRFCKGAASRRIPHEVGCKSPWICWSILGTPIEILEVFRLSSGPGVAGPQKWSEVGMDEPVSPITLALVLRQIMPSLAIAQASGRLFGPFHVSFS